MTNWRTSEVPSDIQPQEYSRGGGMDGLSYDFVANVNVNSDGRLNANVNHFSNDNEWNVEYHHRFVIPKLTVSPAFSAGVLISA